MTLSTPRMHCVIAQNTRKQELHSKAMTWYTDHPLGRGNAQSAVTRGSLGTCMALESMPVMAAAYCKGER